MMVRKWMLQFHLLFTNKNLKIVYMLFCPLFYAPK